MNTMKKRFFSLLFFSSLLLIGVSCSKDNDDDNGGGGSDPEESVLVATADVDFVDEGSSYELKCYREENYGEVGLYGDTLIIFRFRSTDKFGNLPDSGIDLIMNASVENGISAGDSYSFPNPDSESLTFAQIGNYTGSGNIYSTLTDLDEDGTFDGEGSIEIESVSADHIKGTFSFVAYTFTGEQAEVINGTFDSELYHL